MISRDEIIDRFQKLQDIDRVNNESAKIEKKK
jgi:hypothetical protein